MTDKTIIASASTRKAYNTAKAAEAKGYGAFVAFIKETALEAFKAPITVATFAAFVQDDLSVGKEVSDEDKAERNRVRARIRYALNEVDMLEEKARSPQQGKGGKGKTKAAGGKGSTAAAAAKPAKAGDDFDTICSLLDGKSRDFLTRVASAIATRLTQATDAPSEQSEPKAVGPKQKAPAKKKAA